MRSWLWSGLVVGALVAAGCSSTPTQQGVVVGRLVRAGGPAGGAATPVTGAVIAIQKGGKTKTTVVGSNGQFHMSLPVGVYTFLGTATGSSASCVDKKSVVVSLSVVASTQVVCPIR